jgi:serine/threonine-protein kinase
MTGEFEGKDLAEKYEVGQVVRRGEIGDIYRGQHIFMGRPVTLRIVPRALAADDNIVRRFFDEAKTASSITHPNVLNVIDFGSSSDGTVYAVYEGENGETLADIIRESGKLDSYASLEITRQAAAGLAAIHEHGLVHGNLTPENILVAKDPAENFQVKLVGIGSDGPMAAGRADSDIRVEDFAYLAPEQCSGADETDARSDVYALGVIAYEMLAGEPPFSGERAADVMLKHTDEAPPPLSAFRSDLPPTVEPVLLTALAKDPDLRYQSAGEFADDLSRGVAHPPALAAAAAAAGNNIWKTAFLVLAGISLLSVFLIYATSSKRTDPTTALQPDADGQPVQPINPATGAEEQNLAGIPGMMPEIVGNANSNTAPGSLPGGDGYNPWASGTTPPPGAPPQTYIGPGGQTINIPPGQSPFMQDMPAGCTMTPSGLLLCPVTPTPTPKPTATPKTPVNSNTSSTPVPGTRPTAAPERPSPTPAATRRPASTPATDSSEPRR